MYSKVKMYRTGMRTQIFLFPEVENSHGISKVPFIKVGLTRALLYWSECAKKYSSTLNLPTPIPVTPHPLLLPVLNLKYF